jgi:indole-3-acetate monooxygenase
VTTAEHPLISSARSFHGRITGLAPEIEASRRVPQALIDDFVKAGFFHMHLPASLGGSDVDPITAARVVETIAEADGSAAWCLMIATQNSLFAGWLEEADAKAIWGNGGIVAGTARPTGRAVITPGGYTVSGRWPFASGSSHATHFLAECTVYDGDEVRKNEQGEAVTRMTFVPRANVTVHDTWDTLGLRGTASNDFSVSGAFVPEGHGLQIFVTQPRSVSPIHSAFPLVFTNQGSQALGVARAAIAEAIEIAKAKVAWGGQQKVSETPRLQVAIAEATAIVESAREYMYAVCQQLWDAASAGEKDTTFLRSRSRLATSHAVRASAQAVDLVAAAVATSAIFRANSIERRFRDVHTAAAHVMVSPMTFESAGRVEVGLEPNFPFF